MKKMYRQCMALAMLCCVSLSVAAQSWSPVGDKIKSQWGESLTADKPWNVYPRPLLQRGEWNNLNGLWDYAISEKGSRRPSQWEGKILVPYCVESSLSGVGRSLDDKHELWYRRTFTVPAAWKGKDVLLNFDAVDWRADVWVNGVKVGSHTGGYTAFQLNITAALQKGDNEVVVRVADATERGFQPVGKQRMKPHGIWYTPVSGIWQTVWMEPVERTHIADMVTVPDIDAGTVEVDVRSSNAQQPTLAEVRILDGGKVIASGKALAGEKVTVDMPAGFRLWSPDAPNLYDMEVVLSQDGRTLDRVKSYVAMRKVSTRRDADGYVRLQLNNKDIFHFGPLDQGWWPDGLYTPPTYEAMIYDIDKTKQWGFNMIRKHVKVEPRTWYAYCDKVGIIVWQDMPSGDYSNNQRWQPTSPTYYNGTPSRRSAESEANFYKEWKEIIDELRSHPCIAVWVPFNEAWGQFKTDEVVAWTKQYDPYHLINPASGGNIYDCGDIVDMHNYPEPKCHLFDGNRANVMGEYGGIGLPIEGHVWVESKDNWGYVQYKSSKEVTDKYEELADILVDLAHKGYCGGVYTQTTDCEVEVNGIMTYDRKVVKMDEQRLRSINQRVIHSIP